MNKILLCFLIVLITSCTKNIEPVGQLGPNKLRVFVIKDSDFLSASRMLVILDKRGNVTAYSGGTVSGAGSVAVQSMDAIASAGATVLGAQAIEHGLENARIRGIPKSVTVNSTHKIDVTGHVDTSHS